MLPFYDQVRIILSNDIVENLKIYAKYISLAFEIFAACFFIYLY